MNISQQPQTFAYPFGSSPLGPAVPQPSPQPSLGLNSNNPFRNRTLAPAAPSPTVSTRRLSNNPFLDDTDAFSFQPVPQAQGTAMSLQKPDFTDHARELFENLSVNPSPPQLDGHRPAPPPPGNAAYQRVPPGGQPPRRERPERPEKDTLDIFADPAKPVNGDRYREKRRPHRRNSESSIMERTPKLIDADDDEKRRRERRHRDRDGRRKDGKHHSSKKSHYQLDIIDKLDVTSIYGTGMFHHDGPFDACNPHRNRKGLRTAPMQAFPKDSANMALGGAGPVNSKMNLDLFHGTMAEAHSDFASSGVPEPRKQEVTFDSRARVDPVHGAESMGLGTSTFLEGTPASRAAIQRRQSENEAQISQNAGLQRKKSLAQRFRGMNNRTTGGRVMSPEPSYNTSSTSGHIGTIKVNEKNPFFQDYDDAWEKKGAKIQSAESSRPVPESSGNRSPTSPKRFNELDDVKANGGGGGFINRMKSLRKPRRMSDN